MMHHGKKGCKEVLGDVMHLSATSSYLYRGAHWPQKLRGTHLNNVFFKSGFNCLLKFACCLQKMGAIVGHECLEVGHFKAQARRETWLNGTYIRSIKQSPNHATCSHFMRQTIREGKYKNQCSATNTNFSTFCEIHRALAYSCQPFPDHWVMTVLTHCELQTLMFAFTWVIHPEELKNSES